MSEMGEGEGIGLREFGRELGISGEAIRKAIKTGRIPPEAVGRKALRSGRLVPVIIDQAVARLAFQQNTNPMFQRPSADISAGKAAARGKPIPVQVVFAPAPGALANQPPVDPDAPPSLATSRALTEMYKSKMVQLEYEEKLGTLVSAEEFRVKFGTLVTETRNKLLAVPSKAKGQIPHLTVDDIATLRLLMREALEQIALECA